MQPPEGRQQRSYSPGGDPYAPDASGGRRQPALELPAKRLARLGADELRMAAFGAVWKRLDTDEARRGFLDELAGLTDPELEEIIDGVGDVPAMTAGEIDGWARRAPNRRVAAALALVVELARADGPRDGLLRKLAAIR